MGAFFRDDGDGGFEPPRWDVGDPIGFGNDIGAPEVPPIRPDDENSDIEFTPKANPKISIAKTLSKEAFRLYQENRSEEALVLINVALENYDEIADYWNIKGIILDDLGQYQSSEDYYDKAISMSESNDVFLANKVRMYYRWAKHLNDNTYEYKKALEIISKAVRMLADITEEMDKESYLQLKSLIFNNLNSKHPPNYDFYEGEDILKGPSVTLTGPGFFSVKPLKEGSSVCLIKEPENQYDSDAIRVEFDGTQIGYVANSPRTVVNPTKSASEIKSFFEMTTTGTVSQMRNGHIIIQLDI